MENRNYYRKQLRFNIIAKEEPMVNGREGKKDIYWMIRG